MKRWLQVASVALVSLLGSRGLIASESGDASSTDPRPDAAEVPSLHDQLVGWYALPARERISRKVISGRETLIPVSKRDGGYYTICRGVEAPLKPTQTGLEWAVTPSSMEGTRFELDVATGAVTLQIVDAPLMHNDDWYDPSEKRLLQRIDEPDGLPDPTAPPPASLDDLIGWYQPLYFPILVRVTRNDDGFTAAAWRPDAESGWQPFGEHALHPLDARFGFTTDRESGGLIFNEQLRRYEMTMDNAVGLRMPLVRLSTAVDADPSTIPPPPHRNAIGIPSWH